MARDFNREAAPLIPVVLDAKSRDCLDSIAISLKRIADALEAAGRRSADTDEEYSIV